MNSHGGPWELVETASLAMGSRFLSQLNSALFVLNSLFHSCFFADTHFRIYILIQRVMMFGTQSTFKVMDLALIRNPYDFGEIFSV